MALRFRTFMFLLAACGDDSSTRPPDAGPVPPDAAVDAPPDLDDFTQEEQAVLATLSPLPTVPADTTNAYADLPAAAQLGQMLFFETSYSGALLVGDDGTNGGLGAAGDTGKVSCQSCHLTTSAALDDQRSKPGNVSLGTNHGTRNAHGLVNSAFYQWTNWGGRFDSQWSLPLAVAEAGGTMNGSRLQVAHMLWNKYRAEYDALFPVPLDPALDPAAADAARFPPSGKPKIGANAPDGAWEGMAPADQDIVNRIYANYGKALAAYTRLLVSRDAPFDRYLAGDKSAISDGAKRGLRTFIAHCASCHAGPSFSDDDFHAIGVPQEGPHVPPVDLGRYQDIPPLLASPFNSNGSFSDDRTTPRLTNLVQEESQKATFRTKGLRNVADSAPYMHTGQLATLEAVVQFYNVGGGPVPTGVTKDPRIVPLGLSASQEADLVELLRTFTGQPVPAALLVDTSK